MRKRTFMDPKFSVGDANSQTYRDNWEATFGNDSGRTVAPNLDGTAGETADKPESLNTAVSK